MTVPAQDPVSLHTGNGVSTVFGYQFLVALAADLVVKVAGVTKVKDVDYTISWLGNEAGGDVTFISGAPASGASIILQRDIALVRTTDYQYAGDFNADVVNPDFDRLWMAAQGIKAEVNRSIRVAPDSPPVDLELPAPVAFTYLRWNALANKLESVLLADISLISLSPYAQTLLNAVSAAAARLELGMSTVGSAIVTAVDAAAARLAMGAAASGVNNDITGLTAMVAGGLPNNSVLTADIADSQITAAKLSGAHGGSAPIYAARTKLLYSKAGAVTILKSGNVSSVTNNGTGDVTVNFAVPMDDALFITVGSVAITSSDQEGFVMSTGAATASSIQLFTFIPGTAASTPRTLVDCLGCTAVIF